MSRATWLADTLRAEGLTVIEHPGWNTRGRDDLTPNWQIFHHTASNPPAPTPSLGTVLNGRPDLPPPLCNILVGRDDTCHLIAAGTANHAGQGNYPDGTTGNHLSIGWECENNGVGEPWPDHQLEVIARGQAAVCRRLGHQADRVIYHRTFAPVRKIDPAGPGIPQDVTVWQARVQAHIDNPGGDMPLTDQDALLIGIVVKKVLADEKIVDRLEALTEETQGLRARSSLTRRICRAIAHKVGVTQAEIDSQA